MKDKDKCIYRKLNSQTIFYNLHCAVCAYLIKGSSCIYWNDTISEMRVLWSIVADRTEVYECSAGTE